MYGVFSGVSVVSPVLPLEGCSGSVPLPEELLEVFEVIGAVVVVGITVSSVKHEELYSRGSPCSNVISLSSSPSSVASESSGTEVDADFMVFLFTDVGRRNCALKAAHGSHCGHCNWNGMGGHIQGLASHGGKPLFGSDFLLYLVAVGEEWSEKKTASFSSSSSSLENGGAMGEWGWSGAVGTGESTVPSRGESVQMQSELLKFVRQTLVLLFAVPLLSVPITCVWPFSAPWCLD